MARPTKEERLDHRKEVLTNIDHWVDDIDEALGVEVTETKEDPTPKTPVRRKPSRTIPAGVKKEIERRWPKNIESK